MTCVNLDIAPITKTAYYIYASFLYKQVQLIGKRHKGELKQAMVVSLASSGVSACADDCLEVGVRYDGTWMTRGYRSHKCVGFIMDTMRGFLLDFKLVSNFCQKCDNQRRQMTPAAFAA